MIFTKVRKAVAIVLLFALLFSTFPMSALANDNPEETAATEETVTDETAIETTKEEEEEDVTEPQENETVSTETSGEEGLGSLNEGELNPNNVPEPDAEPMANGDSWRVFSSQHISRNDTYGYYSLHTKSGASPVTISWKYGEQEGTSYSSSYTFGQYNNGFTYTYYMGTSSSAIPANPIAGNAVYCIEPSANVNTQHEYSELTTSPGSVAVQWGPHYYTPECQTAIQTALLYGWPLGFQDKSFNQNNDKDCYDVFLYQCATQIIIWEIITGIRSRTGDYSLVNGSSAIYNLYNGSPADGYGPQYRQGLYDAYEEISARLKRHNKYPSFMSASESDAQVLTLDFNSQSGKYEGTLEDKNGVLKDDYYLTSSQLLNVPSGITLTKNGNNLTVKADKELLESGAVVTINTTGRKMVANSSGLSVYTGVQEGEQTMASVSGKPAKAYFKVKADTKTVSIKKKSSATASELACIQGNPLYTLEGAKYEIYEGTYPNGTLRETLTTDDKGNATGTVKYNIGTKLWAKEIVAPSGYLMPAEAQNHYPLTVSSGSNAFEVTDDPTFDPNALEIKKTGTDTEKIQGAVFKATFYARDWMDSTQLKCTWYFMSDANGRVRLDDAHLLSSYNGVNSDPLYKPDGTHVSLPLGCVYVEEVKAANGYILPTGGNGGVCIFIRQGGTKVAQNGKAAGAYWGNGAADPLDTTNPKGIYKIENDAQKWIVTAENTEQGTATMKKSLSNGMNGNLEGYCFNLYRSESGTLWYGRSDANGNIYKTNASHSEVAEANRVYTFTGLEDGTYSFRELLNGKNAKTTKVRIYTSGGITASFNHTYTGSELGFDTNGDCVIGNIALTGLNGGGNLTIEIENTPLPGTMTMRKALTAGTWGSKEGYFFNVHRSADSAGSANTWYGRSDYNGNIYSTNHNHTEVSVNERVYTFEGMTDGTYVIRELMNGKDARTEKIRIYTSGGETAAFDHTYTGSDLSFENNGDCVLSNIPITGLNGGGTLTIEITNTPIYGEPFELIKVDASNTTSKLEGAIFKVEYYDADLRNWATNDDDEPEYTWYFTTDEHGYFTPTEEYLAAPSTGYQSDQEFMQDGGDFPLGYLVVTEVKAPEGFKLSDAVGYWNMVQSSTNPYAADCYWANPDGTHATFGYGDLAYIFPQDDPDALYVKDAPYVKLKIFKTSPNSTVKDIEFLVEKQVGTTWQNIKVGGGYFKTNAAGQIIVDDSQVNGELAVGQVLRITEIVPDGTICTGENPQIITLVAGDNNTVTFENVEISLKIYKTATDDKIKDIDFEVSKYVNNQWVLLGTYTTNASGQIDIETEHLAVGAKFRIKELVPVGTYCTGTNPKTITLTEGSNYVTFTNTPIKVEIIKTSTDGAVSGIDFVVDFKNAANEWDNVGTYTTDTEGKIDLPKQYLIQGATYRITEIVPENYICTSTNPQIVTLNQATTTVNFSNKPFSGLEIIKTSPDGNVENIEFVIEKQVQLGHGEVTTWTILDPKNPSYFTDGKGKIVIDDDTLLETGMVLRITEHVPENYICTSENPKTITLSLGKNSVTFENIPVAKLSLVKRSDDGHVDGIQFKLEKKRPSEHSSTGLVVKERWDLLGTYTTHDGGIILPEEFGALDYDGIYRVTEIVPQGYICENPVQTFTAGIDSEGNPVTEHQVTFENRPIYGNLEITKVDESYPDHKLSGAEFTVTMTTFGSSEQKTKIMTEVMDDDGNGTGVYRLEHIEYGTVCEIRETNAPEGYELSDEVWTVTIEEEKTYTIATPNFEAVINRQVEGQISVHKEDAEHNALGDIRFFLEFSLDDGTTWAPIQTRAADDPVAPGYCTSEGLTDGILTTGVDGNIVFTGLALSTEINSNVLYRLTEIKTLPGYSLLTDPVFEGMLTSAEYDLAFTAVNHSPFKMPMTGSSGFVGATIGSILTVLASLALALLFIHRRKAKS